MKQIVKLSSLIGLLFMGVAGVAQPCNLTGTYTIGPGGNYSTITAALSVLRANGLGGPVVLELNQGYQSGLETYPLSFSGISCISATNNITVRPNAAVTNLLIGSNVSTSTVNLANSRYITFDGRPGGVGSTIVLGISNSSTSGNAVSFSADASYNTFTYMRLLGANNSPNSGVVTFLGSTLNVTAGNSYNTISNCVIGSSASNPLNGIYSVGSTGRKNMGNKVLNCSIYNFYGAGSLLTTNGIVLGFNNAQWEISGNSFYQTADRGNGSANFVGININDPSSNGFLVQNNFIGGKAAGTANTALGYNGTFTGISITVGPLGSTVQGNTVANINWRSYFSSDYFRGILLVKGKIDCNGNTIGSTAQQSNIIITSDYLEQPTVHGILVNLDATQTTADSFFVRNNSIGGIRTQQDPNFSGPTFFKCIGANGLSSAHLSISGNTIGSATVTNSIADPNFVDIFTGIEVNVLNANSATPGYNVPYHITNNMVANLLGRTTGIKATGGLPQITGNTIRHLRGAESMGIQLFAAGNGSNISGNSIHSFASYSTGSGLLTGIMAEYCGNANFGGNFIHSFQNVNGNASQMGIRIVSGGNTVLSGLYNLHNNMIRLGVDSSGSSLANALAITGIQAPVDSTIIAHNSIYIGGNGQYDGDVHTLVLNRVASSNCRIVNNILQSSRYTGINSFYKGAIVKFDPAITDLNGVLLNNNIYYSQNSDCLTGLYKGVGHKGILAWRAATGQDSNSVFYSPNFVNPQGGSTVVDLHLANPNPAEGQGLAEPSVNTDFDGETRSTLSPVDIGADAGNFALQDGDAPILKHASFIGHQVGTVVPYTVSVTDNGTGVDTTVGNKPRMWFQRSYPSPSSWYNVPGVLVQGTAKGGQWSFSPDFAALGLNLVPGDSLAYYFVAQDLGPTINMGYSKIEGANHVNVNTQVTPPVSPLRLIVYGIFSDTVYVGNGHTYTSLSSDGGFFQAAKANVFNPASSEVQVIITSDLQESGKHEYKMFNGPGPKVRIGTNTPTVKVIANFNNNPIVQAYPIIGFNNCYNLTIDGSLNGSGRYLQFVSTNPSAQYCQPALGTTGKLHNFALRNCVFMSNINSDFYYTVTVNASEYKQLRIEGNLFTNAASGLTGLPKLSLGIAPNNNKDTIVIKNNDFVNVGKSGLCVLNSLSNIVDKGLVIVDSNHVYHNSTVVPSVGAKDLISVENFKVPVLLRNNYLGGSARFCGGAPWVQQGGGVIRGIYHYGSYDTLGSIQGNTFNNIRVSGFGGGLTGIYIKDGIFDVGTEQGNQIGDLASDSGLVAENNIRGIEGRVAVYDLQRPLTRIENNIVAGSTSRNLCGIDIEGRKVVVGNNQVYNHRINLSFLTAIMGIRVWLDSGSVVSNTVHTLHSTANESHDVYGMDFVNTTPVPSPGKVQVERNRVYNLRSLQAGHITGMRFRSGVFRIANNQITLSNNGYTNNVPIRGIYLVNSSVGLHNTTLDYNSIVVSGVNGGSAASQAILIDGSTAPINSFANNLLMNQRTGGGGHFALSMLTVTPGAWMPTTANNNLYVANDTNAINQWMANGAVNMAQWRTLSQGDAKSTALAMGQLPPDSLFISWASGNLNINPNTAFCWKVNQKGKPIATIGSDYGAINVRSVDTALGKTDIGADEFDANTPEPPVQNSLCPGGSTAITSDIVGSSHQWQVNTGSGFVNVANGGAYSGATTSTLSITAAPSDWYGYQYRCVVNGMANSQLYALRFANVWTGAAGTAWENAANWSCGSVPDGNTDVTINSGSYVVMSQNGICRSLTVKPGSVFIIAPGVVLTITQ